MVTINYGGRTGNNMFQYLMGLIFSQKFKIDLFTNPENLGVSFGKFFKNPVKFNSYFESPIIKINNNNLLEFMKMDEVPNAHYSFEDFFQKKEFITHMRSEISELVVTNKKKTDGLILIYRLGDIQGTQNELSLDYYENSLKLVSDKKLKFITSDSPNHHNVQFLVKKYQLTLYYEICPIKTIDFASSFSDIILSEGTYNWWIGYLSNHNNIVCNIRNYKWHGDIFETQDWIKLSYN